MSKLDKVKEGIFAQLNTLGINRSDTVLININLQEFGLISGFQRQDYVNLFREFFEKGGGTFFALASTPCRFSLLNRDLPFFDGSQKATTGAFANEMLRQSDSWRSSHPTNSIVAIGARASEFVNGLDENCGAYDFAKKLVNWDGKVLLIGMGGFPGFVTHAVEQDLGLYKQYWDRFFLKVKTPNGVYRRLDPGGCSRVFDRLYPEYIKRGLLIAGHVHHGYALTARAQEVHKVDLEILSKKRGFLICNWHDCTRCRTRRWGSIPWIPEFYARKVLRRIFTPK